MLYCAQNKPRNRKLSNERLITPGGLTLAGGALGKGGLVKRANRMAVDKKRSQPQIKNGDILLTYIGLLCQGKTSFDSVREFHADPDYFKAAPGVACAVPSAEKREEWLSKVQEYCKDIRHPRDGKTVYVGSSWKDVFYKTADGEEKSVCMRIVYEVIERTIDKHCQFLLIPDIALFQKHGFVEEYRTYEIIMLKKEQLQTMSIFVETDRLIITEMTMDMAIDVHKNSLDEDIRRFVPDEVFETLEDAKETIEFLISQYGSADGPLVYALITKDEDKNIGYVQLVPLGDGKWEIGYHVAKAFTGRGYATEAVTAFLLRMKKKKTKGVVEKIAAITDADLYGIIAAEPYSYADRFIS